MLSEQLINPGDTIRDCRFEKDVHFHIQASTVRTKGLLNKVKLMWQIWRGQPVYGTTPFLFMSNIIMGNLDGLEMPKTVATVPRASQG